MIYELNKIKAKEDVQTLSLEEYSRKKRFAKGVLKNG